MVLNYFLLVIGLCFALAHGQQCPLSFQKQGSLNNNLCFRFPAVGKIFFDAIRECYSKPISGNLITLSQIKDLDLTYVQSLSSVSIIRINAIKDASGKWKQLTSDRGVEDVDFSDFPNFLPDSAEVQSTLVWLPQLKTKLFAIPANLDKLQNFDMKPICSAPPSTPVSQCLPEPNCCGNGVCSSGKCVCNAGYRPEKQCCCLDSKTTVVLKDGKTGDIIVDALVTYMDPDGSTIRNITNEMGQILISGCSGSMISLDIEGFCNVGKLTTKPGMNIETIVLTRETNVVFSVVDISSGKPVPNAALKSTSGAFDLLTNQNGNIGVKNCNGVVEQIGTTKSGYCPNALTLNVKGSTEVSFVPLLPKVDINFRVKDARMVAIPTAKLSIPSLGVQKNADINGLISINQCFGVIMKDVTITSDSYCPFTMVAEVDESPIFNIAVELKQISSLEVSIKKDSDRSVVPNVVVEAFVAGSTSSTKITADAKGVAIFTGFCEESNIQVKVSSGGCNGSYVFYRLASGPNKVTLFVTCA